MTVRPRQCARRWCDRSFVPRTREQRYCSDYCRRNRRTRFPELRATDVREVKRYRVLALDEFRVRTDDGSR